MMTPHQDYDHEEPAPITDRTHNNSWSANLEAPRHAEDRSLVVAQASEAIDRTETGYHVNLVTHGTHGHPSTYLYEAIDEAFEDAELRYEFVDQCGCGGYVTRVHVD